MVGVQEFAKEIYEAQLRKSRKSNKYSELRRTPDTKWMIPSLILRSGIGLLFDVGSFSGESEAHRRESRKSNRKYMVWSLLQYMGYK